MEEFIAKAKRDGERELRQMKAVQEPDELDRIIFGIQEKTKGFGTYQEAVSALNQLLLKARKDEVERFVTSDKADVSENYQEDRIAELDKEIDI